MAERGSTEKRDARENDHKKQITKAATLLNAHQFARNKASSAGMACMEIHQTQSIDDSTLFIHVAPGSPKDNLSLLVEVVERLLLLFLLVQVHGLPVQHTRVRRQPLLRETMVITHRGGQSFGGSTHESIIADTIC